MHEGLTIPDFLRRKAKRGRKPKMSALGRQGYIMPDIPEEFQHWPKVWAKAVRYRFYVEGKLPICGMRHVRVVIGRKWVRLCTDERDSRMRVKWKMSKKVWDQMGLSPMDDCHA
jgi:hypothetical protein|tara:strand:- start:493 stop:834 length:342 start_codon:yes stop_codon:yes gene_type:complete